MIDEGLRQLLDEMRRENADGHAETRRDLRGELHQPLDSLGIASRCGVTHD